KVISRCWLGDSENTELGSGLNEGFGSCCLRRITAAWGFSLQQDRYHGRIPHIGPGRIII
ncbi:hypothetical protein HAX54_036019, partial [Datura stramonium]|nr:hypothetical protein [Datura stramonium]